VANVEVVGVYEVDADDPCALVELIVREADGPIDIGSITQEDGSLAPADCQVPYAEKFLDDEGAAVKHDPWDGPVDPMVWLGDVRVAFFMHHLDWAQPLRTPLGDVSLPAPTVRPQRLVFLTYLAP
jgi:hypothetical protein